MKTTKENYTISDTINFKSGVNLGYSLGTWHDDPEILKTANSLVFRYQQHPFCRGLKVGFDKAHLHKRLEKEAKKNDRMDDVFKIHNESREQKDLER